jgi:hypothetical protein
MITDHPQQIPLNKIRDHGSAAAAQLAPVAQPSDPLALIGVQHQVASYRDGQRGEYDQDRRPPRDADDPQDDGDRESGDCPPPFARHDRTPLLPDDLFAWLFKFLT